MTRRALLSMLTAAIADPERLVWQPGAKLISIPKPKPRFARHLIADIGLVDSVTVTEWYWIGQGGELYNMRTGKICPYAVGFRQPYTERVRVIG